MATGSKPSRLFPIEGQITFWAWRDAPSELTVEALLDPPTWAHVSKTLVPGSHIIVQPEGLPWEAELIVLGSGTGFAKVKLVRITTLNGEDGQLPAGMEVKWKGPALKYAVLREADKEILKHGFAIKADAEAWARQHSLAMAA